MINSFIALKAYVGDDIKILKRRPIRILPNGAPGVVYKKKVYELINNDYIDTKFESYSLDDCPHYNAPLYEGYNVDSIIDLSLSVNECKRGERFENIDNALYIKKKGLAGHVFAGEIPPSILERPHEYFQFEIDVSQIFPDFIQIFFFTKLGYKILRYAGGRESPKIRIKLNDLKDLVIYYPNLEEQKYILDAHNQLNKLSNRISSFRNELSLNIKSAKQIYSEIVKMNEAMGTLTEADQVRSVLSIGESKRVEFKSTWSYCLHEKQHKQILEDKCIANIVGFMNADGGDLLIGIDDLGNILGIDKDLIKFKKKHNPEDVLLNYIKDKLKTRIGLDNMQFIDWNYVEIEDKKILRFTCKPAPEPVFLDKKDLAVRFSPAVEILTGQEMLDYIKKRFN